MFVRSRLAILVLWVHMGPWLLYPIENRPAIPDAHLHNSPRADLFGHFSSMKGSILTSKASAFAQEITPPTTHRAIRVLRSPPASRSLSQARLYAFFYA